MLEAGAPECCAEGAVYIPRLDQRANSGGEYKPLAAAFPVRAGARTIVVLLLPAIDQRVHHDPGYWLRTVALVRLRTFAHEQALTSDSIDATLNQENAFSEVNVIPAKAQSLAPAEANPEPEQSEGSQQRVVIKNGQKTAGILQTGSGAFSSPATLRSLDVLGGIIRKVAPLNGHR
jgi:hypothetical protein